MGRRYNRGYLPAAGRSAATLNPLEGASPGETESPIAGESRQL
jgi:hypothetical protein